MLRWPVTVAFFVAVAAAVAAVGFAFAFAVDDDGTVGGSSVASCFPLVVLVV